MSSHSSHGAGSGIPRFAPERDAELREEARQEAIAEQHQQFEQATFDTILGNLEAEPEDPACDPTVFTDGGV